MFWSCLRNASDVELLMNTLKKLVKRFNKPTSAERRKVYDEFVKEFNSATIQMSKQSVIAAYYITLLKLCKTDLQLFNRKGLFNGRFNNIVINSVDDIIDTNRLNTIRHLLFDAKQHSSHGLTLSIDFTISDITSAAVQHLMTATSTASNIVCYMNPPYDISEDVYGRYEAITANTRWCCMYIVETCKKRKMKSPNLFVSNVDGFYDRNCKYRCIITIKNKDDPRKKPVKEVLVSNKSLNVSSFVI